MSKVDPELGQRVHAHLVALQLETPIKRSGLTDDQKIDLIQGHMAEVMKALDLDLSDDSLIDTPNRIAKMYVKEFFRGMDYNNFPKCTTVDNKMSAKDEFVCVKNIQTISLCEHHFLPFLGTNPGYGGTTIAYIPGDKVLGLSKLNRIVAFFAARGQIQERLTNQIAEAMKVIVGTDDVAVYMDAAHTCMSIRGAKDSTASTVTCSMGGKFLTDSNIRGEFLRIARSAQSVG